MRNAEGNSGAHDAPDEERQTDEAETVQDQTGLTVSVGGDIRSFGSIRNAFDSNSTR